MYIYNSDIWCDNPISWSTRTLCLPRSEPSSETLSIEPAYAVQMLCGREDSPNGQIELIYLIIKLHRWTWKGSGRVGERKKALSSHVATLM